MAAQKSIILELSTYTADKIDGNSVWTSSFRHPFMIEDGDIVQLKNCFLDSQKSVNSQIILNEDKTITFTFGYYDISWNDTDKIKTNLSKVPDPTFKPHVAYQERKGAAPDVGMISRLYWELDANPTSYDNKVATFEYEDKDGQPSTWDFTLKDSEKVASGTGQPGEYYFPVPIDLTARNVKKSTLVLTNPTTFFQCTFQRATYIDEPGSDLSLMTGNRQITIPKGSYSYEGIAKSITDALDMRNQTFGGALIDSGNELIRRTDQDAAYYIGFYETDVALDANENSYYYGVNKDDTLDQIPYWYGSSQNAIEFTDRNVFAITYIHTPLVDQGGNQEVRQIEYPTGGGGKIYMVNKDSGIFLLDLQPKSFFTDVLGFDPTNIIVNTTRDTKGRVLVSSAEIEAKTTSNYVALGTIVTNGRRVGNTKSETQAPNTNMLLGNELYQNFEGSGFYLLEITGLKQDYYYKENMNIHINGIVSEQYNASSRIVGFSDSAIMYQHHGAPMILNSLNVRILDPQTKQPSEDLGINNTIILELVKASKK